MTARGPPSSILPRTRDTQAHSRHSKPYTPAVYLRYIHHVLLVDAASPDNTAAHPGHVPPSAYAPWLPSEVRARAERADAKGYVRLCQNPTADQCPDLPRIVSAGFTPCRGAGRPALAAGTGCPASPGSAADRDQAITGGGPATDGMSSPGLGVRQRRRGSR